MLVPGFGESVELPRRHRRREAPGARRDARFHCRRSASAIRRRTVRRSGLRARAFARSPRRRLWLADEVAGLDNCRCRAPPSALACVASPRLRQSPEGACAAWAVRRSRGPASLRCSAWVCSSGDDAFEILADGRRRRVAILGPGRQQLPDHRRQARTCSGLPARSAAAATGCAAPAGACPAPGTADRRSPSRRAGRRSPRSQTVHRSRLNRAARATGRRCCRSRCA